MGEISLDSVRPARSRVLRAAALIVASFAALVVGVVVGSAAGGNVRFLLGVSGFVAYVFFFGRAVRELNADRLVWDHPDSGLLARVSGKSPFAGEHP